MNQLDETTFTSILSNEQICTYFQPIISIINNRVVGAEALCRGLHPRDGRIVPPSALFAAAHTLERDLELDRLCRKKAIESYSRMPAEKRPILFLNFDPGVLTQQVAGSNNLREMLAENGLAPERVAIEIVESRIGDPSLLMDFVSRYRSLGCLIVLDDFGDEQSNLDRLTLLRPDIIKVCRNLIDGITYDYYKWSVLKAIITLAGKIGSLVLAEGVEKEEDIITCFEMGAELFQGYYFARPRPYSDEKEGNCCEVMIDRIAEKVRDQQERISKERIFLEEELNERFRRLVERLSRVRTSEMDGVLSRASNEWEDLECYYLLDGNGTQMTETVFRELPRCRNALFVAAGRGSDHSLKPYYRAVAHSTTTHSLSEPYISRATGNLCRTMSALFEMEEQRLILCADFAA